MTYFKKGVTYRQQFDVAHSEQNPIPYSEIEKRLMSAFQELCVAATNQSLWVGEDKTLEPKVYLSCAFNITPDGYVASLKLFEDLEDKTGFDIFHNFFLLRRDKK